jgi:hypothetical protein
MVSETRISGPDNAWHAEPVQRPEVHGLVRYTEADLVLRVKRHEAADQCGHAQR